MNIHRNSCRFWWSVKIDSPTVHCTLYRLYTLYSIQYTVLSTLYSIVKDSGRRGTLTDRSQYLNSIKLSSPSPAPPPSPHTSVRWEMFQTLMDLRIEKQLTKLLLNISWPAVPLQSWALLYASAASPRQVFPKSVMLQRCNFVSVFNLSINMISFYTALETLRRNVFTKNCSLHI